MDNLFHNGFASGELKEFYSLAPVAFVGGSLVEGLSGHNLAEAAAAGCVVLTGHYIGHFQEMLLELQKIAPLSVQQVCGAFTFFVTCCKFILCLFDID
jgi:3-deoxy-D-manno-octulosonic-acid transferase